MDIATIFDQLVEDKTLVSMEMIDGNFDTLTIIIDTKKDKKKGNFFGLDATKELVGAIRRDRDFRLKCEFTGRDKVKYNFSTMGGVIQEDLVWIKFPDKIDRDQKRKDFRVTPSLRTKFRPSLQGKKVSMDVLNLSMGGALVMLDRGVESSPTLDVDHKLINTDIVFPAAKDKKATRVTIKRSLLIRVEEGPKKTRFRYAVKFLKVDPANQQKLRKEIYNIQREELRRKKMAE